MWALRAIDEGYLLSIAMRVVDAHSILRDGIILCIKPCTESLLIHHGSVMPAWQFTAFMPGQCHASAKNGADVILLCQVYTISETKGQGRVSSGVPYKPTQTTAVGLLTNIEGLISVRNGAWQVKE